MEQTLLARRRDRTHAIVEGALLGDLAIVLLLMRVYLPILVVRTLIRALASVPFIMLTQRRGVKLAILAALASYILFSALVGPILALTAPDVAVAGILIGLGRRVGLGPGLNTLWTGPVYAVLDIIIPAIVTVILFRYPIKDLIGSARNFMRSLFHILLWILHQAQAPLSVVHTVQSWQAPVVANWQLAWLATAVVYGFLTMYLAVLVSFMVLRQVPSETLSRQAA
ncbi:MAG TPA: DUF2232 domain-containing protein [Chloroflexota bacterium]|nr:DUF2232 domain-containing protein [Chloroflexota bacterium]